MKSIIFLLTIFIGVGVPISTISISAFGQVEHLPLQQEQPANEATKSNLLSVFGKLPLNFVANCGQFPEEVVYYAKSEGATVYCTEQGLVFGFRNRVFHKNSVSTSITLKFSEEKRIRPEAQSELKGKVNYFIGNNPALWQTGIPTFKEVVYREVYPGIDLVYSGNQKRLKYTFYLQPNSDPNKIQMIYDSIERLWIDDATGELVIQTEWGEIRDSAPVAYQEIEGVRKVIDISFRLPVRDRTQTGLMGEKRVGFAIGDYDPNFMLTLDPVYSTYLGGSNSDSGYGIAVDNSGNAYVTGQTWYFGFPTQNPYQSSHGGGNADAFVTKLSSSGDALIYSTYLGGSSSDYGHGIAVDSSGDAYVTGHTYSTDFPTTQNSYQRNNNGGRDAFVTRLSSDGKLIYSTYIGGKDWDEGLSIAVDNSENVYVTGCTNSSDFPAQSPYQDSRDVFVTKLSSNGDKLIYFTYIGGSDWDEGKGLAVDNSENVYVTGYTKSSDFPAKNNPYQSNYAGNDDAFVTKLSVDGNILYSTYLGGLYDDSGNGIAIDSDGNVYVTGSTSSPNFPIQKPYQNRNAGGKDTFVTKLSINENTLIYSTYLGGLYDDSGNSIDIDGDGNAYVTGYTSSPNFPVQNPYQSSNAGMKDAFVTKLSSDGNTLIYSTYIGGLYDDSGNGIDVDSSGNIYVTGYTLSPNFPTQNSFQRRTAGSHDVFVASFWEPPKIMKISPESGSTQGGTLVTIEGDNFFEGVKVFFGNQTGRVTKVSKTKIEVFTPPLENIQYEVYVTVQNLDGQSDRSVGKFFYIEPPHIDSIIPKSGTPKGGTVVIISGKWFMEGTAVTFGGNAAEIVRLSDTEVKIVTPSLITEQPKAVDVVITNPDNQSDTKVGGFIYTESPHIDNRSPISSTPKGGTVVIISGKWFMEGATVTFGGNAAEIVRLSDMEMKVITPSLITEQPKAVDVVITNPDGQSYSKEDGFVYTEPPRIDKISPISGTPKGGTTVTISGQWFLDGVTVNFGDKPATIKQVSATTIEVVTPPLEVKEPTKVDIMVENPYGQRDMLKDGYIYTEAPRVDTISPSIGTPKGGTVVTLSGQWFMPKTVLFGDQTAEVKDSSATHITVVAPPLATGQLPKKVDVIVVNVDSQSFPKADGFVYTEAPHIEKISPISGTPKGETVVTISGSYFTEGISVTFGNKPATIRKVSATAIEIFTPPLEVEEPTKVNIMVENPYGQRDIQVDGYIYTESPRIDTTSPGNGSPDGGTLVTISGQWFMEKATVFLGDNQATIIQLSTNRIEILTPPVETEQPRQVDVVVSNPDGKIGRKIRGFTYTRAPLINNISPDSGAPQGGTIVKISGQWFFEGVTVTFGKEPATIIRLSVTEIQVITPPLETKEPEKVDVMVKNLYGQSDIRTDGFTYTEALQIDKISPEFSAPEGGIFVAITGKWFWDDAKVTFDTVPAAVTKSSATAIEVVVPPLATDEPKKVDVIVENPNGQIAKRVRGFVYTKAPEIDNILPVNGIPKGGTRVTITGKWFMEDVAVTFGGNPVEAVKWLSSTTLEVVAPPLEVEHPTSVDVAIANVYGQSDKRTNGFIYTEAPHIEKISPISGTPEGGTQITISGKWFIDGSSVKIGGTEASEVKVKSDTEITAITPPGSLGKKDVIVINPYLQVGILPGGFEYKEAPTIQRIQPVVGPLAGNTQLTINGSGFVEGAIVKIGEKETRPVTYVSESQLIAITPPSAKGLKDVIVINPDGQKSDSEKFNYVDFPGEIRIYNFPNPFQTGQNTTFRYKGGNGKKVEIKIFNLAGELVKSLSKESGETIDWDGMDLEGDKVPPGLYPYVYLLNGKFEQRQLLQVIK